MATANASPSEILRAKAILLFRLDDVRLGPWSVEPGRAVQSRGADLRIMIERVYKGNLESLPREPFNHHVTQRGIPSGIVMDDYGLWSHVSLARNSRVLAFCPGHAHDARALLTEEQCERLYDPPEPAATDVERALALEAASAQPAEIVRAAAAPERTDMFARYVWAKSRAWALASGEHFAALLELLTSPRIHRRARQTYLSAISEELSHESTPAAQVADLVRALFVLLRQPESQALRPSLVDVYLPNTIGLAHEAPRVRADEVFAGRDGERRAARESSADAPQLLTWLS